VKFNDGCGDDIVTRYSFDITCPAFTTSFDVSPVTQSILFNPSAADQQNVRLEANPLQIAPGYENHVTGWWNIVDAPSESIFYPWYMPATLINTTVTSYNRSENSNNGTTDIDKIITTTTERQWYRASKRVVNLVLVPGSTPAKYPTCFRPDVGHPTKPYVASLTLQYGNTGCQIVKTSTISVTCSAEAPVLTSVTSFTQSMSRFEANRVFLNASGVTDLDTPQERLVFNWKVLYPTLYNNPFVGEEAIIVYIEDPHSMVASMWIPHANIDYIVELSVTDHCHTVVKNITIKTPCDLSIPLNNKTLAAVYDGTVPVQFMSFAYDHTIEIANYVSYPKCQRYEWSFVDYSVTYSDNLFASVEPEFVKTAGFAGLIAAVVIVAVIVPIIIWAYCTKKACFKNTDPRV